MQLITGKIPGLDAEKSKEEWQALADDAATLIRALTHIQNYALGRRNILLYQHSADVDRCRLLARLDFNQIPDWAK